MHTTLKHLGIIMDGNGRWAQSRGHTRFFGHTRGARVAKMVTEECARLGLTHLTLFAFSTENWRRPKDEVSFLMKLLAKWLNRERQNLVDQNIRFQVIGEINRLPMFARNEIQKVINDTRLCYGMTLTLAVSYGGRQEILTAVKSLAQKVQEGSLKPDDLNEEVFSAELESAFLPDPDLILRTSGESRISNFMLWQSAYSEIQFIDRTWPDFKISDLHRVIDNFEKRERRFGQTSAQILNLKPLNG